MSLILSCRLYNENLGLRVALPVKWNIVHHPQRTPSCLSPVKHTTAQRRVRAASTVVHREGESLKYPPCLSGCRVVSRRRGRGGSPHPGLDPRAHPCLRARAPGHRVPGRPVLTARLRAFRRAFLCSASLPEHFPACLALGLFLRLRWVSGRRPSLGRRPSVPGTKEAR